VIRRPITSQVRSRYGSTMIEAEVEAVVWRYSGDAAWYFLTLPLDVADDIRARGPRGGFGSVRVTATIGSTTWSTSVFPSKESGSYVLPVKADVRHRERIDDGTAVTVRLELDA
jgi:hypothetical protein